MKKKSKLIILLGLVFTMLFGNIFTVSAAETTANWWQMITGKSVLGSSFEFQGNISDINNYYDINLTYGESSVPVYGYAYAVQGTAYGPESYSVYVYLYSESPFSVMGTNINCNGDEIESEKENLGSYDVMKSSYQGKEYYCTGFNSVNTGIIKSDLPVNLIKPEKPIYNFNQLLDYLLGGGDSDFIYKPTPDEVNRNFYLKNIGYSVRAENSSEYPDETFIKFTWDTNNLKSGDVLEIRTRNHYTKIGGDQVIGFHDYITYEKGVSCYNGFYEISQTDAVKAWFKTVDNKPLIFKDYDTDIYFLRPVRNGEYFGMWVKVTMIRKTPTSSPQVGDIEYGDITTDGDWIKNDDITISEGGNHGIDQDGNIILPDDASKIPSINSITDLFKYLFGQLENLISMFGQLPSLINSTIGWLPSSIIILICSSIVVVIILRIFGR